MVFHVSCLVFSLKMFIFACGKNALSFIILSNLLVHRFTFKQCNWGNRSFYKKDEIFLWSYVFYTTQVPILIFSPLPQCSNSKATAMINYIYIASPIAHILPESLSLARMCQHESDSKVCAHLTSQLAAIVLRHPPF